MKYSCFCTKLCLCSICFHIYKLIAINQMIEMFFIWNILYLRMHIYMDWFACVMWHTMMLMTMMMFGWSIFLRLFSGGWGGFWFMFMEVVGFDFFFLFIRAFDDLPTYRLILWIIGVSINSKLFDLCEDLIFEWDFSATDTSRISAMLLGF